eukprot:jgi/Chlat1/8850/Chrsp91S08185
MAAATAAVVWLPALLLVWRAAPAVGVASVSAGIGISLPSFEVAGAAAVQSLAMVREVEALSCGTQAYAQLLASCRTIIKDDNLKKRMAVLFTNCFLQESGRGTLDEPAFPCEEQDHIKACTAPIYEDINNNAWTTYFGFYKAVDAICHHLQSDLFVQRTEEAVSSLQAATMDATSSLHSLSSTSLSILSTSHQSLVLQQQLHAQNDRLSKEIGRAVDAAGVLVEGQRAVEEAQRDMEKAAREGFGHVHLGMDALRSWQEELIRGSAAAAQALADLRGAQDAAWLEARGALAAAREAHVVHANDEAAHHAHVASAHQHILNATRAAASAQEEFVTKQAEVFTLLSRILSLHAMLARELLTIKALVFYASASLLSFTLTSVPRTAGARLPLYFGLTLNFPAERCVAWAMRANMVGADDVGTLVSATRTAWAAYACVCVCVAALMYKDYARLAHESIEELRANIVAWKRGDANKSSYARQLAVMASRQRAKFRRSLSLTPSTPRQARSPLLLTQDFAASPPCEALDQAVYDIDDTDIDPDYVPPWTDWGEEGEEVVERCYDLRPRGRRQVSRAWAMRVRRLLRMETAADFASTVHLQCLRTLFGDEADRMPAAITDVPDNCAETDTDISDSCDIGDKDNHGSDDGISVRDGTHCGDDADSGSVASRTRKRRRTAVY